MLTTSVDTKVGSDKGDLFEGIVGGSSTLTPLDSIDGKEGKDTLNILDAGTTALELPAGLVVKNVEIVNVRSANDVGKAASSFDVSGFTGLTDLNITQADAAYLKAATTTDVNVSGATGDITVKGGKDITITDNTAASSIKVEDTTSDTKGNYATGKITITDTNFGAGKTIDVDGGTDVTITATADKVVVGKITVGAKKAATGDVKIVSNTTSDGTAVNAPGDVTVTGGKTVEITANMTNTAVKGVVAGDITAGKYTVTADNTTTNVTITQNATATNFENDAAAGTAEVSTVTFGSLKAGEKAIISAGALNGAGIDLTFTASKDLTAEQVAAAFANLTAADKQSATGITANGYFSGTLDTGWTSGAVSGSSVTFTATTVGNQTSEITVSAKKADNNDTANKADFKIATTNGTAAGASTAVNVTEDFGDVVVDDNATKSITTITLDGFDKATLGATVVAGAPGASSLDKLATLNLTNGTGATALTSTVATLTVNVDDMAGTVDLSTAATNLKTLTLNANGEDSKFALTAAKVETLTIAAAADLDISTGLAARLAALKTVTITGAGDVTLGDISTALETLSASAATGDISATVKGTLATVTTGSGNDTITATVANATTAISKDIDLGAGDDTLVLFAGTTVVPTAAVKGGAGVDTISMTSDSAYTYDDNTNFSNAISGFERLVLSDRIDVDGNVTIDMEKLGFSYVTLAGGLDDSDNTAADTLTLANIANNGTVVLANTMDATGAQSDLEVTVKNASTGTTDVINVVVNNTNTAVYKIDLTNASAAVGQTLTVGGVLLHTNTSAGAQDATAIAGAINNKNIVIGGVEYDIDATTLTAVTLTAKTDVAISETSLKIEGTATLPATATATIDPSNVDFGTVTIAGVETINLTSSDATTSVVSVVDKNKLTLTAVDAKTVNVTGNSDLDLSTGTTSHANLKTVDALAMTGALTYTIKSTVADFALTSGSGADKITVDTSNNAQVKTGAGNDTIIVKSGAVSANIWGGAGNDIFDVTSAISSATQYVTIEDATSGDQIKLGTTKFLSGSVSITDFDQMTLTDKFNAVLTDTGLSGSSFAISFQHANNTYIVVSDGDTTVELSGGADQVIKLTGLKDLSAGASFNVDGTLEIA